MLPVLESQVGLLTPPGCKLFKGKHPTSAFGGFLCCLTVFFDVLWTESCPPPNSRVKALTPTRLYLEIGHLGSNKVK